MTLDPTRPDTSAVYAQSGWGGPCEWPVDYAWCSSAVERRIDSLDEEERGRLEHMAIEYLWNWTGQRFGLCLDTLRPCRTDCRYNPPSVDWARYQSDARRGGSYVWAPVLIGNHWQTIGCGTCGTYCNCAGGPQMLRLPGQVHSVIEVVLDGVVLPTDAYYQQGKDLIRLDGKSWPTCQNMTIPEGSPGTWSLPVLTGEPVPQGGRLAAGLLAEEFAKAVCKDNSCALPANWASITRQGISITQFDVGGIEKGLTGIWLIDSWVSAVTAPRRPSAGVLSPDYGSKNRRS